MGMLKNRQSNTEKALKQLNPSGYKAPKPAMPKAPSLKMRLKSLLGMGTGKGSGY